MRLSYTLLAVVATTLFVTGNAAPTSSQIATSQDQTLSFSREENEGNKRFLRKYVDEDESDDKYVDEDESDDSEEEERTVNINNYVQKFKNFVKPDIAKTAGRSWRLDKMLERMKTDEAYRTEVFTAWLNTKRYKKMDIQTLLKINDGKFLDISRHYDDFVDAAHGAGMHHYTGYN